MRKYHVLNTSEVDVDHGKKTVRVDWDVESIGFGTTVFSQGVDYIQASSEHMSNEFEQTVLDYAVNVAGPFPWLCGPVVSGTWRRNDYAESRIASESPREGFEFVIYGDV